MSRTLTIIGAMHAMDGSGFYRFYLPFGHLGEQSHHIVGLAQPGQPIFQDPREIQSVDVLVLQRPATKAGVRQMEQIIGKTKVVYETDDDLLQADSSGLPHLMDEKMKESIRRCMRLADMITVSTPYLAERATEIVGPDTPVMVLPNMVDEGLLKASTRWKSELDPERPIQIGWAGGTSHLFDMVAMQGLVRRVLNSNPDVVMGYAGYDYSPLQCEWDGWTPIPQPETSWTSWQNDVTAHYKRICDFDISIAPLANIPFNHSKSNLRALESAACGIPCVATDLTPYRDFIVDGVTGFLCRTPDEMERRLNELVRDEAMRIEMGAAAKELAKDWTVQANWELWQNAYELAAD